MCGVFLQQGLGEAQNPRSCTAGKGTATGHHPMLWGWHGPSATPCHLSTPPPPAATILRDAQRGKRLLAGIEHCTEAPGKTETVLWACVTPGRRAGKHAAEIWAGHACGALAATHLQGEVFLLHRLLSCKEQSKISPWPLDGFHIAQPTLPFTASQSPWLPCPWRGHGLSAHLWGVERLGNGCSPPALALTEQTLAVLALAGATAYFWKLLRHPRRGLSSISLHSQTGSLDSLCVGAGMLLFHDYC